MLKKSQLYNHQKQGVELILENNNFGLFMDMGLGKTATCLTAVDELINGDLSVDKVLVTAPKRVTESTWLQEAENWEHLTGLTFSLVAGTERQRIKALHEEANIYLVSRDNIAWLCAHYGGLSLPFDMLIVDESSSYKNHKSQRFKALKRALSSFSRVVILTGTPAPNGMAQLWPQIYLLDQGERLGKTITNFRESYLYAEKQHGHIVHKYGCTQKAKEEITAKISDIVISMEQADYLDLPPFVENDIKISMPDRLRKQYKDFEREKVLELYGDGGEITAANAAALSNKLLQFANGTVYDEDREAHEVHSLKLDELERLIEDAQGSPILVAYTYRSDMARILKKLKNYGAIKLETDEHIRAWNRGEVPVMLMHPASGGHGLNLQHGGHQIIWYGNTWDLELLQQFNHRLKRPSQKNNVIITKLITSGTFDENVVTAQKRKGDEQQALIEAVKFRIAEYIKP